MVSSVVSYGWSCLPKWLFLWGKQKCSCAKSMKSNSFEILLYDVMLRGHDEYTWGQRSIMGISDLNWPLIDLLKSYPNQCLHAYPSWPLKVTHAPKLTFDLIHTNYLLWPHRMISNHQINFKAVLIFIDLRQLLFCFAYKNSPLSHF